MLLDELAGASLVIVDFDGTLVYLEADWQALRKELETYCSSMFRANEAFSPLDAGLRKIKNNLGDAAYERLLEKVSMFELRSYKGKNVDDVVSALLVLPAEVKTAVFSRNCRQTIEKILLELGLNIGYIVAKEDIDEHKPSGLGIIKILDFFRTNPEDAIFIGDSDLDLSAGKNAGVKTLLWMNSHD